MLITALVVTGRVAQLAIGSSPESTPKTQWRSVGDQDRVPANERGWPAGEVLLVSAEKASSGLSSTGDGWLVDPGDWFAPEDNAPVDRLAKPPAFKPPASKPAAASPIAEPPAPVARQPEELPPPSFGVPFELPADGLGEVPLPDPEAPPVPPVETDAAPSSDLLEGFSLPVESPARPESAELPEPSGPPTPPPASARPAAEPPEAIGKAAPVGRAPAGEGRGAPREVFQPPAWVRDPGPPGTGLPVLRGPALPPAGGAISPRALVGPGADVPGVGFGGSPHGVGGAPLSEADRRKADLSHAELFAKNSYPSASECAACHKRQYEEWRISSHAYSFVSPMYHKFEQKISELSQGTVGYFCQRCHSPVGTAMGMDRAAPLWEQPKVAREGVTCIACHRVNEQYARNNGERRIVPGPITDPVYGGVGGDGVAKALVNRDHFKVKASADEPGPGQVIHNEGRFFQQLSHSEFCTSCHQVAVHPGIKLEVVWDQYRRSPACEQGVTCQDCHMGKKPGEPSGYAYGSIAEVGGRSVSTRRKRANHTFYGPNYSIAHPGVFPHNDKAYRWGIDEWVRFDWRAGWGTDAFEDAVAAGRVGAAFPPVWADADDRCDAREIIEDNLKGIARKREVREEVMGHSLKVAGPFFKHTPARGADLRLHYDVTNLNSGHNVLTASLGAQPQLWANVVLIGPGGLRLWESGYTDSDGDVCDLHSRDVRAGRAPFDRQLFNLQTMFLITGATGTDREMPLPVNVDFDQLPFLRPGTLPVSVTNHPPFIRMESRSIAPLGTKRVKYHVPGHLLARPGRYRLTFRMRNRIEPIWFMRFCDSTDEMVRAMNEGVLDLGVRSVEFWVR